MRNYRRLDSDLRCILGCVALLIGVVAGSAFFGFMAEGPPHDHAEQVAARDWQLHTATVTGLGQAFGGGLNGQPVNEYVDMTYTNFYGHRVTITHMLMPASDKVGSPEPVMVGRDGSAQFVNDPSNWYIAPGQDEANWFGFLGFIGFVIIWITVWTVLFLAFRRLAYCLVVTRRDNKRRAMQATA